MLHYHLFSNSNKKPLTPKVSLSFLRLLFGVYVLSFAYSSPVGGMLFGVSNNNNNNRRLVTLAEHTSE